LFQKKSYFFKITLKKQGKNSYNTQRRLLSC